MGCSVRPSARRHRSSDAKPEWDILYFELSPEFRNKFRISTQDEFYLGFLFGDCRIANFC
jgi:hypothetical protein